jgi:hypothetical protein
VDHGFAGVAVTGSDQVTVVLPGGVKLGRGKRHWVAAVVSEHSQMKSAVRSGARLAAAAIKSLPRRYACLMNMARQV